MVKFDLITQKWLNKRQVTVIIRDYQPGHASPTGETNEGLQELITEQITYNLLVDFPGNQAAKQDSIHVDSWLQHRYICSSSTGKLFSKYRTRICAITELYRATVYRRYIQAHSFTSDFKRCGHLHSTLRVWGSIDLIQDPNNSRVKWLLGVMESLDSCGAQASVHVSGCVNTNKFYPADCTDPNQLYRTRAIRIQSTPCIH